MHIYKTWSLFMMGMTVKENIDVIKLRGGIKC